MFVLKHSEQLEQALAFLLFSYPCYLPSLQKWLIVCGCVTEPLNAKRLLSEYSSINQPVFFMTDGVDGAFPHYKRCPHPRCRTTNVKMLFRQLVYHFHPSVRHFVYQFTTSAESYPIITPCTALFFFFFFFFCLVSSRSALWLSVQMAERLPSLWSWGWWWATPMITDPPFHRHSTTLWSKN